MFWIVILSILIGMVLAGLLMTLAFCLMIASARRDLESEQMAPPIIGH